MNRTETALARRWPRYLGAGLAAIAALLMIIALSARPAGATGVSASKVITANGEAGYYAGMDAPGHFTQVQATFYLRVAAEGLQANAGEGVQLCNDTTGNAVQLGVRWNSVTHKFDVMVGSGTLTATPGTNTTPCNSGGAFTGITLTPALSVPQGDTVHLILKEVGFGHYEAFAKDITNPVSASKSFAGLAFPDEASAGVVQNATGLSAPATNSLVRFTSLTASDSNGRTASLRGGADWTAVQAVDTANGLSSDPALVTPAGSLTTAHPRQFSIFIGAETGV